ncbi:BadF/BadG/BcrA/BcrD ATPase family protein [Catenuloplanes atrovinosus]|uniref:N-acetylglucosamine kinase-like BadF-type ATPase n=1 Tax=Catenuloplanes atrovinosus TaxID=137266 RepID=A0AAE4C911_9ACTN|nr:BadF/BadG/BcrA/BcrD ATPase family protein [Catenuloplanes atrovinosus]MDR7276086.1 N-acetylglucosamine kinase-like BadF-type ATPase [Catenuloplanes atrovinosus]
MTLVAGIDVGGSGVRARAVCDGRVVAETSAPGPVRISGADLAPVITELLRPLSPDVVVIGCAGVATFGPALRDPLLAAVTAPRVAVCSDLLTAYAGGLGLTAGALREDGGAGVVLAAGTGAVAFGGAPSTGWRRADGWGHLLGDDGGGGWIGRAGMRAALRAVDGRPGGSAPLLELLRARAGEPAAVVADLTGRADRAGVLAAFAPSVAEAAADDPVAASILAEAAGHLADTARAAAGSGARDVAVTGNLVRPGGRLAGLLERACRARGLEARAGAGTPLDGAVTLASALGRGDVPAALAEAGALTVRD